MTSFGPAIGIVVETRGEPIPNTSPQAYLHYTPYTPTEAVIYTEPVRQWAVIDDAAYTAHIERLLTRKE